MTDTNVLLAWYIKPEAITSVLNLTADGRTLTGLDVRALTWHAKPDSFIYSPHGFDVTIEGICAARVVRFAAPRLFEDELGPDEGWVVLDELRYGAVFETRDGIRAVKSESHYDPPLGTVLETQCLCILLASGEFAHFPDKNETEVREVLVP